MLCIQLRIHQTAAGFWHFFLFFLQKRFNRVAGLARKRRRFSPFEASLRHQSKLGLASQILWHENVFKMSPLIGGKGGWKRAAQLFVASSCFSIFPTFWLRSSALICTEKPELVSERGLESETRAVCFVFTEHQFHWCMFRFSQVASLASSWLLPTKGKTLLALDLQMEPLRRWKMESV